MGMHGCLAVELVSCQHHQCAGRCKGRSISALIILFSAMNEMCALEKAF